MTLQTLEYFIAVSQYRNFTKAAQACHVTQPALSRAIRGLEEELGCSLLIRSGRTVTLTPEGEVCLAEARRVLQQCEELELRVREVGRKNQRPLRVGYLIISHLNAFMQYLGRRTEGSIPFNLETVYGTNGETKQRLLAGEVDVILLPELCVEGMEDVEWAYITRSQLYAIVHKANRFYDRKTLRTEELKDQPFVMWTGGNLPILRREHIRAIQRAGFAPRIVGEGEKMGDLLAQITLHNGVGLGAKTSERAYPGEWRFIRIEDSPEQFGVICVWRKRDQNPQLTVLKGIFASDGEEKKP